MAPLRKLTGAQAELFAAVCHHYIGEAGSEFTSSATPDEVPIFSHLSRAQRLTLIADVAVGMLCEDEPLPPDTIQHNSAYRAIIEFLFSALSWETDTLDDVGWDNVGEDLLGFDDTVYSTRERTDEELEEFRVKEALIEHRAEKNMKKLNKGKDVGEFHVDERDTRYGATDLTTARNILKRIFDGGPVSKRERDSIRPLTDKEKIAFRWRRLCDAALQEDTLENLHFQDDWSTSFPLCNVNFDWRCETLNKWKMALNLLFDTKLMDYGSATDRALVYGSVDYRSYADPSQLPRVKALERHINLLMKVYASTWDPKLLAIDQRRIYAVCSKEQYPGHYQKEELHPGHYHEEWAIGFHYECLARGINLEKSGQNYQARLNVFRDTKDDLMDGCEWDFRSRENAVLESDQRYWTPKEEGPKELGFLQRMCSGPGKLFPGKNPQTISCWTSENLQACSRCRAVLYCSRECQIADWKRGHKNVCARLAKERKDKEKISQLAKDA
ncbi:hypothetical protein ACHAWT_001833 [Skeletonema menzelii]